MAEHNFILANGTWGDRGTISAASSAAGYPVTNLQTMWPHRKWRSTSLITQHVQINTPAGYGGNFDVHVILLDTNARAGDEWRIRASADTSPETSPNYDSGQIVLFGAGSPSYLDVLFEDGVAGHHVFNANFNVVSVRIDFSFPSHPDGFYEASRFIVASEANSVIDSMIWKPSRGPIYGGTLPSERPVGRGTRADGGPLYPEEAEIPVSSAYDFPHCTFQEARDWRHFLRKTGGGKDVVALQNTGEPDKRMEYLNHGVLRNVEPIRARKPASGAMSFDIGFEIESIAG